MKPLYHIGLGPNVSELPAPPPIKSKSDQIVDSTGTSDQAPDNNIGPDSNAELITSDVPAVDNQSESADDEIDDFVSFQLIAERLITHSVVSNHEARQ